MDKEVKDLLRRRNRAFLWILLGLVAIFYGLSIVRMGGF